MFVVDYDDYTTSSINAKPRFSKRFATIHIRFIDICLWTTTKDGWKSCWVDCPTSERPLSGRESAHHKRHYILWLHHQLPSIGPRQTRGSYPGIVCKTHWANPLPECQCRWTQLHMKFHQDLWGRSMVQPLTHRNTSGPNLTRSRSGLSAS